MVHGFTRHSAGDAPCDHGARPRLAYFCARSVRALWRDYAPNQALRFLLRGLLWPRVTYRWCRFIAQLDFGATDWTLAAGLLEKPHRPYINVGWNRRQRLAALLSHYQTIGQLPRCDVLRRVHAARRALVLLHLAHADYRLVLGGSGHSREGELELELQTLGGLRIVTVLFAFVCTQPTLTVAIGCLQGGPPGAHADILAVSKAFDGTPVKLLITRLLRRLVLALVPAGTLAHLVAVDDAAQVFQHRHYRAKRKVSASYAATWQALGGSRRNDGFWELPLTESPPDYQALKSSKRGAARRRWQALQALSAAMHASLDSGTTEPFRLDRGSD